MELKTLEKYKNNAMLGTKVEEIVCKKMVIFGRCKGCAKHKAVILANLLHNGSSKAAIDAYIKGANFMKKCTID